MDWIKTALTWYFFLATIGVVFFPLTKKLFQPFSLDLGYPFAKIIGLLLLSYTTFLLGTAKIMPFSQSNLILLIFAACLTQLYFFRKHHPTKKQIAVIIFEEILFLGSFFFWTYIRGQEGSIHGLEKFMDFGFINSILKSKTFPPLDIWLSADPTHPNGYPINYYYFGHLIGAVLIRLSGISSPAGYNLILSSLFALGVTQVFSLVSHLVHSVKKPFGLFKTYIIALLGSFIVNLGGNLHTIYLFTKGYPNEHPVPFWQIMSFTLQSSSYWYPNATRFIPFTIHEFPIYSYIVADLHGHVFDIPIVLLTLSLLVMFFLSMKGKEFKKDIIPIALLGSLCAIHYMTNAFDGPIYLLLASVVLLFRYKISYRFVGSLLILFGSFLIISFPFSSHFIPFVSGIGVNCSPSFLTNIGKIGPFLFEKDKCQVSPLWMLGVLWGFFWINFLILTFIKLRTKSQEPILNFCLLLFYFSTLLIFIPEFFYIKDIYPAHFRANTMFKLGYQAFIMMGIASAFTLSQIKKLPRISGAICLIFFSGGFFLISLYPIVAIPSYYGKLQQNVNLDGTTWIQTMSDLGQDSEIINYLNTLSGQPNILEAQGDSYTDYERISAMTGLPTVAGWWVHEWLWRGSSDIVGTRIPDIVALYESQDLEQTKNLIKKYRIEYVIVSKLEKQKYTGLFEAKWYQLGRLVFETKNQEGRVFKVTRP